LRSGTPPPLRPRKSLGQHFLRDENIARKIVEAVRPGPEDVVVEIGPGEGSLTRFLIPQAGKVIAIEIDSRAVERLQKQYTGESFTVIQGDFLETDLSALRMGAGKGIRIVGNIPYNITSPILFHILDHRNNIQDATLMMQTEVAERIVARPRTKAYGILAVSCQLLADVKALFQVSPNAFFPKPQVRSTVISLTPLESPRFRVASEEFFRTMIRALFGKRRKTMRNSLKYFLEGKQIDVGGMPFLNRRPEELSPAELAEMSNQLYGRMSVAGS
jgi:16S rRNA (adenine1518-N6/adenine1519-N6)-dimethyltransferase